MEGEEYLKEESVPSLGEEEGVALSEEMGVVHHEMDDAPTQDP